MAAPPERGESYTGPEHGPAHDENEALLGDKVHMTYQAIAPLSTNQRERVLGALATLLGFSIDLDYLDVPAVEREHSNHCANTWHRPGYHRSGPCPVCGMRVVEFEKP